MKKGLWWSFFAVLVLATAFFALAAVLATMSTAHGDYKGGAGAQVGSIIFLALIGAICAWSARSVEHHARTNEGLKVAARKGLPAVGAGRGSPRRLSHLSAKFELMLIVLITVIFAWDTGSGLEGWLQSRATQGHGASDMGTVTSVVTVSHFSRSGNYDTYNLDVTLEHPVDGRSTTVVTTNFESPPAQVGQTVVVLVDRSDPGYAELPGQPVDDVWGFVVPLVLFLLVGATDVRVLRAVARAVKARRANAAHPPASDAGPTVQ